MYIKKQSQPFHIILNICKSIVNKNCFWLLFDLFETTSETEFFRSYLVEQMKSTKKIRFECSFIAQNPFQTILGLFKIFEKFSKI